MVRVLEEERQGVVVVAAVFFKQSLTGVQCRISIKNIYMTPTTGSFLLVLQTLLCTFKKYSSQVVLIYGSAVLWLELATG